MCRGVVYGEDEYVTSWDTWLEVEASTRYPGGIGHADSETGRVWHSGAPYEQEAARSQYDVWWRVNGNRYWHQVPGVLADSVEQAALTVQENADIPSGALVYAYPRESSGCFVVQ